MNSEERKKELMEWIRAIVLALIVGGVLSLTIRPTLVSGNSMTPTLNDRNYLIIDKMTYRFEQPNRGDIIVFKTKLKTADGSPKDLIKRIIALPGDSVKIIEGVVYINNQLLEERYLTESFTEGELDVVVPTDKVFVLGDNRRVSMDSRSVEIGFVPIESIRGRVLIRVLPVNDFGQVN